MRVPFFILFSPGARRCAAAALCALVLATSPASFAAPAAPGVGRKFETLSAGNKRYENVEVRSVSVRSITFTHAQGMASLPLRELTPELQHLFGYSEAAETAADAKLEKARHIREARRSREIEKRAIVREASLANRFERLIQEFGHSPVLHSEIDLRPKFRELSLGVKDQGRRPSCSVFAVVSALEFQNAQFAGTPEKLSEEYLVWATRRSTRRVPLALAAQAGALDPTGGNEDADAGFSLSEVVGALREYGIPLQSAMPNTFGTAMAEIAEPAAELVDSARSRRKVFIHVLSSRDVETQIANLVHALNAEVPAAIGLRWPHARTLRNGYLSEQRPILDYAHAVTLVGYRCETGRLEDSVFIFKNSYGVDWGQGGYGFVTYKYLRSHLLDAVLLEVQRADV